MAPYVKRSARPSQEPSDRDAETHVPRGALSDRDNEEGEHDDEEGDRDDEEGEHELRFGGAVIEHARPLEQWLIELPTEGYSD